MPIVSSLSAAARRWALAKALALRTDLPQIVLPTTYAGSEATPVLGETREGQKSTIRSMKVLPEVIVYDVELICGLLPAISLVSATNAIAHAVEALYAEDSNPVSSNLAEQGISALPALPQIISDPVDRGARADAPEPGYAERALERSGYRSITSCVTSGADPLVSRMQKPTQ
jgi:alcohol dehydrogenase class IV